MYADHPFDLLNTVSGFLDLTEPRPALHEETGTRMSLPDMVESFEEIDLAATTAALHVIATLMRGAAKGARRGLRCAFGPAFVHSECPERGLHRGRTCGRIGRCRRLA